MTEEETAASRAAAARLPLSFFEWLLVGFLVTSGALHVVSGLGPWLGGSPLGRDGVWELAVGTFSLLLSGQVFLRDSAARYSIALLFLMQVIAFVQRFAIRSPESWLEASVLFRVQRLVELGFFAVAMALLLARPRRSALL